MNKMHGGHCKCGPFRVNIVPQGLLKPYILKLLSEKPMHGFELMERIFERTNGMWNPGPAAVYPTLEWLEANGYIESMEKHDKSEKVRKQYKITEKGISALSDYERESKQIAKRMEEFSNTYKRI